MWQQILIWVLKFVLQQLGDNLNDEMRQQAEDYDRRKAEAEIMREQAEIELGRIESERLQLEAERRNNQTNIDWHVDVILTQEQRIKELNERKHKNIDDLHRLSDDDILRSKL